MACLLLIAGQAKTFRGLGKLWQISIKRMYLHHFITKRPYLNGLLLVYEHVSMQINMGNHDMQAWRLVFVTSFVIKKGVNINDMFSMGKCALTLGSTKCGKKYYTKDQNNCCPATKWVFHVWKRLSH